MGAVLQWIQLPVQCRNPALSIQSKDGDETVTSAASVACAARQVAEAGTAVLGAWRLKRGMRIRLLILSIVVLAVPGCEAGYSQSYRPIEGATPEQIAMHRAGAPPKTPAVEYAPGANSDLIAAYEREGYGLIGLSSFDRGHPQGESDAIGQAQRVGADIVVLIDPQYAGSRPKTVPDTTPTSPTTNLSGTATAPGLAGTAATAYGNTTSTSYGTHTPYIPTTVDSFDYGALYFVRQKPGVLGVSFRDLTDPERSALTSNKGVYVNVVVDQSPAFAADVLRGDIIVSMDGVSVVSQAAFSDMLLSHQNKTVQLGIVRNGQVITKQIKLNRSP